MIDNKTIIKHLDNLLLGITDIGNFNISSILKNKLNFDSENATEEKIKYFNDLHNAVKDFGIAHKYFKPSENEYKIFIFKLTKKGIKAKELGGHLEYEKYSKKTPLTLYQKLQLTVTLISLITAITFGVLNHFLNIQKSDLKDENNLLKNDLVHYKDSLNLYKKKTLLKRQQASRDTLQTKNFLDLKND